MAKFARDNPAARLRMLAALYEMLDLSIAITSSLLADELLIADEAAASSPTTPTELPNLPKAEA